VCCRLVSDAASTTLVAILASTAGFFWLGASSV
jgi:hypothetical protein